MAQPPAQDMFYPYQNSVSRSPTSARQTYASVNGPPALGGGRPAHRQVDVLNQGGAYDRFGSFESAPRYDRMSPASAMHNAFALNNANSQPWNYTAGAATVNGAMHDAGRMRPGNRRPNLHAEWMGVPDQHGLNGPALQSVAPNPYAQPFMGSPMGLLGSGMPTDRHGNGYYEGSLSFVPPMRVVEDQPKDANDVITTAIVIKNIPFNVRKEALSGIMQEMNLPIPYAFNYHFDQGVFRGLAFANFQTPEDTRIVIEKLNGYEVQGRKLRVEYKKMLPEHERERIEREKREKRGQLEEQHQPIRGGGLHNQSSIHSLSAMTASTGGANRSSPLRDLNLNNPETLGYYTELTLFRNDPSREVMIFPQGLAPEQRRAIHILAHNLGLFHQSINDGEARQVQVLKRRVSPTDATQPALLQPNATDSSRRGLSRAATFDLTSNHPFASRPLLDPLTSPDSVNGLRGVKSFADLRSFTPSPSLSQSSYVNVTNATGAAAVVARYGDYAQSTALTTPTTPGAAAGALSLQPALGSELSIPVGAMGSLSLGGFEASNSPARPRDNPGAIGSQRPGAMNGASGRGREPDRQPRGPGATEWDTTGGFGRGRTNGHMQRSSDSSDTAVRAANPSFFS